METNTGVK